MSYNIGPTWSQLDPYHSVSRAAPSFEVSDATEENSYRRGTSDWMDAAQAEYSQWSPAARAA